MRIRSFAVVAALASLSVRPKIELRPETVRFGGLGPRQVIEVFRRRMGEHPDVLVEGGSAVVARFEGRAGPFPFRTVEVVDFEPDRITFEHLSGPFARCEESFEVTASASGSDLTHAGSFVMRAGLLGWLLGVAVVRSVFERHVLAELERTAAEAGAPVPAGVEAGAVTDPDADGSD